MVENKVKGGRADHSHGHKGMTPMAILTKVIVLVVLLSGGLLAYKTLIVTPYFPGELNNDAKKAVFLNNGEVYFGDVSVANKDFLLIENPYYLRSRTELQGPLREGEKPKTEQKISLTALGGEGLQVHGPERAMYVRWDSVTYIENLTANSEVVKTMLEDPNVTQEAVVEEAAE